MKKSNYIAAVCSTLGFAMILVAMVMLNSNTEIKLDKNILSSSVNTKMMAASTKTSVSLNNNLVNNNVLRGRLYYIFPLKLSFLTL